MANQADITRVLGHQAWALLLNAQARVLRAIEAEVAGQDLLPLEAYDVLLALEHASEGKLRLSELADRIVFSRSGLTRLIDRLEAKRLLRRERCAEDRRGAFAVITDAGRKAMAKTWPVYRDQIEQRFIAHLTPEQARAMRDALAAVLAANGGTPGSAEVRDGSQPVALTVGRSSSSRKP